MKNKQKGTSLNLSPSHLISSINFGKIPNPQKLTNRVFLFFPRYFLVDRVILSFLFNFLWGNPPLRLNLASLSRDHQLYSDYATLFPSADFFYIPSLSFTIFFPYTYRLRGHWRYSLCFHRLLFPGGQKGSPVHLLFSRFSRLFQGINLFRPHRPYTRSCFAWRKRPLTFSRFVTTLSQRYPLRPMGGTRFHSTDFFPGGDSYLGIHTRFPSTVFFPGGGLPLGYYSYSLSFRHVLSRGDCHFLFSLLQPGASQPPSALLLSPSPFKRTSVPFPPSFSSTRFCRRLLLEKNRSLPTLFQRGSLPPSFTITCFRGHQLG